MDPQANFRVVTYNILHPKLAMQWKIPEGITQTPLGIVDNWAERKQKIIENLLLSNFSVACLQEVDHAIINDITEQQPFRSVLVSSHSPRKKIREIPQEGVSILYNSSKVELIYTKLFKSLEGNPQGTRGELFIDVKDKATRTISRIASLHLKGYKLDEINLEVKQTAMQQGLAQLKTVIATVEKNIEKINAIFICGDFNEDDTDCVYSRVKYLKNQGYQEDGNRSYTHLSTGKKLDWIFFKSIISNPTAKLHPFNPHEQHKASDHCLIGTDVST